MSDGTDTFRALEAKKALRLPHETVWRDCFAYTYPLRGTGFNSTPITAQQAQDKLSQLLIDPTSTDACRTLTSSIMSGMTPANSLWFGLEDYGSDEAGNQWLSESARALWTQIHAANFDSESYEANLDGVIAGWFVLYVSEDKEQGGFVFTQWPLSSCYVSASRQGGPIDTILREYELTVQQAVNEFGINEVPDAIRTAYNSQKFDDKFKFVHHIYPREGGRADATFARNMPFASCHVELSTKKTVLESGYHEFPCVVPRWMKLPATDYAVGPVNDALPAIKRLSDLCRMELAAADLAVAGMWIAEDDGVLNPRTVKVGPRKVIVANSVDSMKELKSGADFNVTWSIQDKLQQQIKAILMADQLPPADGPAKTAYEYSVRVQMIRQALGPIYGRLQSEYLKPFIEICFAIAYRVSEKMWAAGLPGVFTPPPESIRGKELTIKFESPLARSQKQEDVGAMDQLEGVIINRAQIRPEDLDLYNWEDADRERAKLLGVPGKLMRKPEEVAAIRKAREQQVQQQQQQAMLQPGITEAGKAIGKQVAEA